ncbi:MAG: cobalamin-dependent protein [Deltaproteobacteria bacterium]|nr:cobalamin-dependent protein [Deltaproteobacteria bacterium]
MSQLFSNLIKAYGDRRDDGMIQISFTLPVDYNQKAKQIGKIFAEKLGLREVNVTTVERVGDGFTMFVVYGHSDVVLDVDKIDIPVVEFTIYSRDELDNLIGKNIGRKIKVVGACTGSDAHTVGIDAILNMKGFAGDYGLERYKWFEVCNLGAQITNDVLIEKAIEVGADAILLSQVVTQRNIHKENSLDFVRKIEEKGLRNRFILILGGPRIDHPLAVSIGFDAGFGAGTKPSEVASYIYARMLERRQV